jgi:integrator complex subunit 11
LHITKRNLSKNILIFIFKFLKIINGIKIKPYYAGHVLGACMFSIEYQNNSLVYTGDFNSSADRHLGACWIEKINPDVLITESIIYSL